MKLNELIGTKYPLIQGGMANIATGEFAAAVSNAGALGLIASGSMDTQRLREQIKICRGLTDKPFGVNLMMMNPQVDDLAQLMIDEKVPVVTTGAGNPGKYVPAWKEAGIKVLPVTATVALARRLARSGADALIIEGTEAGGHVGELTTMALVPQVLEAVDIPVIAAGGIACGRQVLAAFALGAIGVQVGTCLLVAEECPIHENYKQSVLKASDTDTTVTGRIAGVPVRSIKNKMTREYLKREKEGATRDELEEFTLGSLRRAVYDGDTQAGSFMAGQVAGLCNEIKPVKEIIEGLFADCKKAYDDLSNI
ncbi:MAG: enoyl-[acyl-carrier-protein] reductase FabK [Clostridiales bacterium]|jgi:enoyl-[acyl-carrier protein] reductase II|nr:enoyl-[acyl-carrier-protein] reductase FabK [Clostridiales bacterium]